MGLSIFKRGLIFALALTAVCLSTAGAAAPKRIAVLELHNAAELREDTLAYLTDLSRGVALRLDQGKFTVITRENLVEMLPPGVDLAACEGECEVETGRNIGAHYVVSGEVIRLGDALRVNLKLYNTESGALLAQRQGGSEDVKGLEEVVEGISTSLLSAIGPLGGDDAHFGSGLPMPQNFEAQIPGELPAPPGGLAALDVDLLERLQEARRMEKKPGAHPDVLATRWWAVARHHKISPEMKAEAERRARQWVSVARTRRAQHRRLVEVAEAMARDETKLKRLLQLDDDVLPQKKKRALTAEFNATYQPWRKLIEEASQRADAIAEAVGVTWVKLPAGEFDMGSRSDATEGPVRTVKLPGFAMAQAEVTVAQYRACVEAGACSDEGLSKGAVCNWGRPNRDDHPINCLSWAQARDFSWWIGGRLPSEAEWEYAARGAGEPIRFPWGNSMATCGRTVFRDRDRPGCGSRSTQPVCSLKEGHTAQGLCDMAGNVWEWVSDVYVAGYEGAPADGRPRLTGGKHRVARGGAWFRPDYDLRTTRRGDFPANERGDGMGCRPVRVF
ncbi:MAG: SUMF1/EgtB/PvdO family nonheme iron enzyme [Bradymonadia bacterium]